MNILGLVFPSLFQQSDQQQTWQSNDSMAKCSAASLMETTLRSRTDEALQDIKTQENPSSNVYSKKASDDPDELPTHFSDVNKSVVLVSNSSTLDEPVKKTKRTKKKKGKLCKMSLDNDANQESTADSPCLTFPRTQSSSKAICCSIGLTESDQKGESVIHSSVHNKTDDKCNSTCLQSILNSEVSKQLTSSGDFGSSDSIDKVSSGTSVLQDLNFIRNKVDKISNTKVVKKQYKSARTLPNSAVVRSATELEPIGENLEDASCSELKLARKSSHLDSSNPNSRHKLHQYGNCRSSRTSGNCSNGINYGAERRKTSQSKVIADGDDCMTKCNSEATHISQSVDLVGPDAINLRTVMGVERVSRDHNNKELQCNQFSMVRDAPTIASSQNVKHDRRHSQSLLDSSRMPSSITNYKQTGKENSHFVWQKTGKYIGGTQNSGREKSQRSPDNSATDDGLLPVPQHLYASGHGLRERVENLGVCDHEMSRTNGYVLAESPERVPQQRFNANLGQNAPRRRSADVFGNMTCTKYKLNQSRKENANYYKRGFWISKANLSKPQSKPNLVHKEALEVSRARYDHKILCEILPHDGAKIPRAKDITGDASHVLLAKEDQSSACFDIELPHEKIIKECNIPREILQKWIPVVKDSSVVRTDRDMKESRQEGRESAALCETASLTKNKSEKLYMYIGSEMTVQSLDAAYSLQIASERVLSATGRPIAEFDKFLRSVSPVIIPSFVLQQHCEGIIIKYQPVLNSITNFQNSDVSLGDVWRWYERPGNYGLEVKAEEDSQSPEGMETEIISFSAHFVPFLSAVQLLCSSADSEVIFEYFAHEPPQHRKPLFAKVKDLVEAGTSDPLVFGDSSMLECINMKDLHPASWYSVAWYPIYRIPEGSFRTCFLTYHSLGSLVMRHIESGSMEENTFCAISPVLGMQSYNAQGESWFLPKKPTEYHLKILNERLTTLEENADLFARGHVRKGQTDVQNRHPDYEFFLTRKLLCR